MSHVPNLEIRDGINPLCKLHGLRVGEKRWPKGNQGGVVSRERQKAAGQAKPTDAHDTGQRLAGM